MSSVGADGGENQADRLDPRRLAARLDALHRQALDSTSCETLELYHRASLSMRLRRDPRGEELRFGMDEGLAVRGIFREDDALRFAAGSGGDAAALARVIELARRGPAASETRCGGYELAQSQLRTHPMPGCVGFDRCVRTRYARCARTCGGPGY